MVNVTPKTLATWAPGVPSASYGIQMSPRPATTPTPTQWPH